MIWAEDVTAMVRGAAKHVIVIKNPDKRIFEQAIFIVKRDLFRKNGQSEEEILLEARRAAEGYVKKVFQKQEKYDIIKENIDKK